MKKFNFKTLAIMALIVTPGFAHAELAAKTKLQTVNEMITEFLKSKSLAHCEARVDGWDRAGRFFTNDCMNFVNEVVEFLPKLDEVIYRHNDDLNDEELLPLASASANLRVDVNEIQTRETQKARSYIGSFSLYDARDYALDLKNTLFWAFFSVNLAQERASRPAMNPPTYRPMPSRPRPSQRPEPSPGYSTRPQPGPSGGGHSMDRPEPQPRPQSQVDLRP